MGIFQKIKNFLAGVKILASVGYQAGSTGRRAAGWTASRLGPNLLLQQNLDVIRDRSREAVRNDPMARSACNKWESNIIGSGISPHFLHPDPDIRLALQKAWDKWAKKADFDGRSNFAGLQALLIRECFDGGEGFVRLHVDKDYGFQLQLIEGEQVPLYMNQTGPDQSVEAGVIFDVNHRKIGYQIYRSHPYDFISNNYAASTEIIEVPVADMLQVFKPLRAGQLRGEPAMAPVLTLLRDLSEYADSERLRKKIAAMFVGFIKKNASDDPPIIPPPSVSPAPAPAAGNSGALSLGEMTPGVMQELLAGEDVEFPEIPDSGDYAVFMKTELRKFAAGVGITYEQLTGDLEGVNYSSIRAGLIEFRRSVDMYQRNVVIQQFCDPVLKRWLKEAMLAGEIDLPDDYFQDPEPYEDVSWARPKFDWVDPQKDATAAQMMVRSGFTSRTQVVRELGFDPDVIDAQQAEERKRAADLGLIYDSDPNVTQTKGSTNTENPTGTTPGKNSDDTSEEDE